MQLLAWRSVAPRCWRDSFCTRPLGEACAAVASDSGSKAAVLPCRACRKACTSCFAACSMARTGTQQLHEPSPHGLEHGH